MSANLHKVNPLTVGTPVSFHSIKATDETGRAREGGDRFNPEVLCADQAASLADEMLAYERQLEKYSFGYLRVSVDGEEVAIFDPQGTACEPFKVLTTASFIEVTGEDDDGGGELLLAVFTLTHLDPCRRVDTHRMSVTCGRGQIISLIVSSPDDENEDEDLSSWIIRLECISSDSEADHRAHSPIEITETFEQPRGITILRRPVLQSRLNPHVRIAIVGLGSSGSNTVDKLIESGIEGVTFACLNTDLQALQRSHAPTKVQLGPKLTRGLGTGSNPMLGRDAALESTEAISEVLYGADMVFITTGMGGGTGTGAAPVVASLAKEFGALTVAAVATPFSFEGRRRMRQAQDGLGLLCERADTVITLPNERLLDTLYKTTSLRHAFAATDNVLRQTVQTILDVVTTPGLINLDFAVVRSIMTGMGSAFLGTGRAWGEVRALEATQQALFSPLLEETTIEGAKGILINVTGGSDLTLHEVNEASSLIREAADDDANIIFGAVIDDTLRDEMKITVIAAGYPGGVTRATQLHI